MYPVLLKTHWPKKINREEHKHKHATDDEDIEKSLGTSHKADNF